MGSSFECPVCGNTSVDSNHATGFVVCNRCGLCVDSIRVVSNSYNSIFNGYGCVKADAPLGESTYAGQCITDDFNDICTRTSAPYKPRTYFNERLSQWRGREPPIPDDRMEKIKLAYIYDTTYSPRYVLAKDDIRKILKTVEDRCSTRFPYGKRYLEKWITIRRALTGVRGYGAECDEDTADQLRDMFKKVYRGFLVTLRGATSRYSLPSYNFIFRRLFDLLGKPVWGCDFPLLKNNSKRCDLVGMWLSIIRYTGWPYINSDVQIAGLDNGVDWEKAKRKSRELNDAGNRVAPVTNQLKRRKSEPDSTPTEDWTESFISFIEATYDGFN